jgi:hypothetical protein
MAALLNVPYFRQTDNEGGQGWRECASSCSAMLAAFFGKVASDDEFNRTRRRFGDSTDISAQTRALSALGLEPLFRTDGDWATVEHWLGKGRPIILPYLHNGPVASPRGGGHWAVGIGTGRDTVTIHDPMGEPDLLSGGHIRGRHGRAILCTRRNFGRRWMVEGPGTGWYLTVI